MIDMITRLLQIIDACCCVVVSAARVVIHGTTGDQVVVYIVRSSSDRASPPPQALRPGFVCWTVWERQGNRSAHEHISFPATCTFIVPFLICKREKKKKKKLLRNSSSLCVCVWEGWGGSPTPGGATVTPEYALSLWFLVVDQLEKTPHFLHGLPRFPRGAGDGPSKKKSRDDLECLLEGYKVPRYGVPSPEEHAVPRLFKTRGASLHRQAVSLLFFFVQGVMVKVPSS